MRATWLLPMAATMLAGCATPRAPAAEQRFLCTRGLSLVIRFMDDHAMVSVDQGPEQRFESVPTASGFGYKTSLEEIRGKGKEMTYSRGNAEPARCTVDRR